MLIMSHANCFYVVDLLIKVGKGMCIHWPRRQRIHEIQWHWKVPISTSDSLLNLTVCWLYVSYLILNTTEVNPFLESGDRWGVGGQRIVFWAPVADSDLFNIYRKYTENGPLTSLKKVNPYLKPLPSLENS